MQPEIANILRSAGCAYHRLQKLNVWQDKNISFKTKLVLYKVIVQSALLYGYETWAVTEVDAQKLEVFQMRCLRRLCGLSLKDRVPNTQIRATCNIPPILSLIRFRRLRWLGHTGRMDDSRLPLQLLFSSMPGTGAWGRPLKRWNDYVRDDLEIVGEPYNWWRKCKDRGLWRKTIKLLLDVPSP